MVCKFMLFDSSLQFSVILAGVINGNLYSSYAGEYKYRLQETVYETLLLLRCIHEA